MRSPLPWCGVLACIGGAWMDNEFLAVLGLLYLAIEYSTNRVIAAINGGKE